MVSNSAAFENSKTGKSYASLCYQLQDLMKMPQVLFVFATEKQGGGVEA